MSQLLETGFEPTGGLSKVVPRIFAAAYAAATDPQAPPGEVPADDNCWPREYFQQPDRAGFELDGLTLPGPQRPSIFLRAHFFCRFRHLYFS